MLLYALDNDSGIENGGNTMEVISNWSKFKEYAKKHPKTDVAELKVWDDHLLEHAILTPIAGADLSQVDSTDRYEHYFTYQILASGFDRLTSEATRVLQTFGFDIELRPKAQ